MPFSADTIVIHPGELVLKGGNRSRFEERLLRNVSAALKSLGDFAVRRSQGVITAKLRPAATESGTANAGPTAMSPELMAAAERALLHTAGVSAFSFGASCARDLDAITVLAREALTDAAPTTFKVRARRSDKTFPMDSQAIAVELGGRLLDTVPGVKVDVNDPRLEIHVAIDKDRAFVSTGKRRGPNGLPTGVSGKVAALLSGGIDSPVASWALMRRGCEVTFVHFHSYPHVGRESIEKVKRLAGVLAEWQAGATLFMVPLAEVQRTIVAHADPAMRVVLYRRAMLRIAERIARTEGAQALVTGDSVGQVASQTLENIAAVSAAATMPIFRPLIGENKDDIVADARRVGTYEISIEPHEDCCSVFMPPKPATKSTAAYAAEQELRCPDLAALEEVAIAAAERIVLP